MASVSVGLAAVQLPIDVDETPVIQNLGPGIIYIDTHNNVSVATGLKIPVGDRIEYRRDVTRPLYAIADAAGTDVRVLIVA